MQNCCAIMHSMKKAVKESDRKPMSPTESISMEETYNGEHSGAGLLNMRSEQEIK